MIEILDVNNTIVEDRGQRIPVMHIYGVGGETAHYKGFKPYFYASMKPECIIDDIMETIKASLHVDVEITKRFKPLGYQEEPITVLKIICDDPSMIRKMREEVKSLSGIKEIYEADILFKNRFLIDKNLGGSRFMDEEFNPVESNVFEPMKIMSIDIECLPPDSGKMPTADKDNIIMVQLAFSPPLNGKDTMILIAAKGDFESDVIGFESEERLLWYLGEVVFGYDPDVITGYNINEFDFPYMITRYNILKVGYNWGRNQSPIYLREGMNKEALITGRVVFDLLPLIRKNYNFQNYQLRTVAHELLKWDKLDLPAKEMKKLWHKGEYQQIIDYGRRDAQLALGLLQKTRLLDRFRAISRETGLLLQDCVNGGQTGKIEMLLMREYLLDGYLMAMKPEVEGNPQDEDVKYEGAVILNPERGLLKDVVVDDYRSLYPTITIGNNISYDTIILEEDKVKFAHIKANQAPVGGLFVDRSIRVGIMPRILRRLLENRMSIKAQMKKLPDGDEKNYLDAKQYALKILLNSFYGYSGYTRARLFTVDIAAAVTSYGRKNIMATKALIEDIGTFYLWEGKLYTLQEISAINLNHDGLRAFKMKVVYGDTDSLFTEVKEVGGNYGDIELDVLKMVGEKIGDLATERLPEPMALLYEKVAKRLVFEEKKKYAMLRYDKGKDGWKSKITTSGLETVRRDWPPIVGQTLKACITEALEHDNTSKALEIAQNAVQKIIKLDSIKSLEDVQDLVITRKYTKPVDSYKVETAHIKVAKKMLERGAELTLGDRIRYLVRDGREEKESDRADTPEYFIEQGLKLDKKYYVNKLILPPLHRFLGCFGYSIHDIYQYAPRQRKVHTRKHTTSVNHKQMTFA